jgi:hypothetical protein
MVVSLESLMICTTANAAACRGFPGLITPSWHGWVVSPTNNSPLPRAHIYPNHGALTYIAPDSPNEPRLKDVEITAAT